MTRIIFAILAIGAADAAASTLAIWNLENEPLGQNFGGDDWNGTPGTFTPHTSFQPSSLTTEVSDVEPISPQGASQTGLSKTLNNNPGALRKMLGSPFEGAAYGPSEITERNASFELLLSPDTFDRHNQVIFDVGGADTGVGLALFTTTLRLGVSQGNSNLMLSAIELPSLYNPTPDFTDYLKITISIDLPNDQIGFAVENLGTGLRAVTRSAFFGTKWAGPNGTGIFQINSNMGGNANRNLIQFTDGTGFAWQNFDGQLAQFSFHDVALPVPEPSRPLLAIFSGFIALTHRRRG